MCKLMCLRLWRNRAAVTIPLPFFGVEEVSAEAGSPHGQAWEALGALRAFLSWNPEFGDGTQRHGLAGDKTALGTL